MPSPRAAATTLLTIDGRSLASFKPATPSYRNGYAIKGRLIQAACSRAIGFHIWCGRLKAARSDAHARLRRGCRKSHSGVSYLGNNLGTPPPGVACGPESPPTLACRIRKRTCERVPAVLPAVRKV